MSKGRLARFALLAALAALPFVLVARAGQGLVGPLSAYGARCLLRATAALDTSGPTAEAPATEPTEEAGLSLAVPPPAALAGKPGRRPQKPVAAALSALFVSRAKVLELARSAARPRGAFVSASSQHPAGLLLSGVAALGIGVQDGDILIEALGATPRSPGQVIGAIIEARAQKARALSGTLWRQGQTLRIVVEQPYAELSSLTPAPRQGAVSVAD